MYLTLNRAITISVHVICKIEEEPRLLNDSQYIVSINRCGSNVPNT
jgi:hypothetical protein